MEGRGFVTFVGLVASCFVLVHGRSSGLNNCDSDPNKHCAKVRCKFSHQRIGPPGLVPDNPVRDEGVSICYNGLVEKSRTSCCTKETEAKYVTAAKKFLRENIVATNAYLKKVVLSSSLQHQEQFLAMIQMAENNTDSLLNDAYSVPWQERREVLKSLFLDLQKYVLRKPVNIYASVSEFFDKLFPLAFRQILNDPTLPEFSDEYKDCLMGIRQELYPQPFGDIPHKISVSLSRSLSAAKSFLEQLAVILKALNFTDDIQADNECSSALTRLQFCSHCNGYTDVRPCKGFCVNVMRGCLAKIAEISQEWDELVGSLGGMSSRMKGPFSIQEVLRVLDAKVSNAIMHAMEFEHRFYSKVMDKCGPLNKTTKEIASSSTVKHTLVNMPHKKVVESKNILATADLQETVSSIMEAIQTSAGLYSKMADTLCNNTLFYDQSLTSTECWNGHNVSRYNKEVPEPSFISQVKYNPEVKVSLIPDPKLMALREELAHLKKVLSIQNGEDMMQADWSVNLPSSGDRPPRGHSYNYGDDEDLFYSGSGSGDDPRIRPGVMPKRPINEERKSKEKNGSSDPEGLLNNLRDNNSGATTVYTITKSVFVTILLSTWLLWKG